MAKFVQLFLVTVLFIIVEISSKLIGNILSDYYKSDLIKSYKAEWTKYRLGFESAIKTNLLENYGTKSMNIYIRHSAKARRITTGFYFSDNVVNVLFTDMILREWPKLIMPEVSLSLSGNLLKVEATVGKMLVDTTYFMHRNESEVLFSEADLNQGKNSPFSLQQVQRIGNVTIAAEDCFVSGFSIVTLLGNTVALGHSTFRLFNCKFTVEISSDAGIPPVIAPYFPSRPSKQIETLLSAPIRDEMIQNLQGAMVSYINTSVIFDKELKKYKLAQHKVFNQAWSYLSSVCEKLNNLTLEEQKSTVTLNDFEERLERKDNNKLITSNLSLKDLKLYGLDTAYASRTGGSYEASKLMIADAIRFHALQLRGTAVYDNGIESHTHNFAAELVDFTVNVIINIEQKGSKSLHKFDVLFVRSFDFSVLPWETGSSERIWYQALVSGYIINEVPARITEHLSRVLTPAVVKKEQLDSKSLEDNSQSDDTSKNTKIPENNDDSNQSPIDVEEDPNDKTEDENISKNSYDNLNAPIGDTQELAGNPEEVDDPAALQLENVNLPSLEVGELPDLELMSDNKEESRLSDVFENAEKVTLFPDNMEAGNENLDDDAIDDNGENGFVKSDENGSNDPVGSEENVNNDPVESVENVSNDPVKPKEELTGSGKKAPIFIFASVERESVPIERVGKKNESVTLIKTVNKNKSLRRMHKRNQSNKRNLKLTPKRNLRANAVTSQVQKLITQKHKQVPTSKAHKNGRTVKNEAHMSENEVQ